MNTENTENKSDGENQYFVSPRLTASQPKKFYYTDTLDSINNLPGLADKTSYHGFRAYLDERGPYGEDPGTDPVKN